MKLRCLLASSTIIICGLSSATMASPDYTLRLRDSGIADAFAFDMTARNDILAVNAFLDEPLSGVLLYDLATGQVVKRIDGPSNAKNIVWGWSLDMNSSKLVVGTPYDGFIANGSVFVYDVPSGAQLPKIVPQDSATNELFGWDVAVDGNVAVIGAPHDDSCCGLGSVYAFDLATNTQLHKLRPADVSNFDHFGTAVDVSGNIAIVGTPGDNDLGENSGSAYLFDMTTGAQLRKLLPADGETFGDFGHSVAINGNYALVGAPYEDSQGADTGAAYLFDLQTGQLVKKFTASTTVQRFGWSVGLNDAYAVVGALADGANPGAGFLFDLQTGNEICLITAAATLPPDRLGFSSVLSNNYVVVGAPAERRPGYALVSPIVPEPAILLLVVAAIPMIAPVFRRSR